jgi:hypothetical protein
MRILVIYWVSVQEEKETRRIRRVLANRESARQTIRRRQVFTSADKLTIV